MAERGLSQRELLDLFDRCEAHPTIRAAIRGVLQPGSVPDTGAEDVYTVPNGRTVARQMRELLEADTGAEERLRAALEDANATIVAAVADLRYSRHVPDATARLTAAGERIRRALSGVSVDEEGV
jgi:hypothetical protein